MTIDRNALREERAKKLRKARVRSLLFGIGLATLLFIIPMVLKRLISIIRS